MASVMRGLAGKVALVTGAGQGIGAAIATRLAAEGCVVAVNSYHADKAEATAARLRESGARAQAFRADVSQPDDVERMVLGVEATFGQVNVLVNNAAVLEMERLVDLDLSIWARTIAVNLTGPFLCARRVVPGMVASRWGRIVNMSSIWGLIGARGATAYCAAKGGLIEMTRALGAELGPEGVAVSAVAPGVIDTPQLNADAGFAGLTLEAMKARYALDTVVGRVGTPQEIAHTVAFLASEEGMALCGQVLPVTGGRWD
jgi:NAD(P)-dependent dehydrogenase (short-subunit alcohol dehydrogenase family)